ncbi:MAG: hypothetical protein NZM38_04655 [Cytophagales bacterium]|nr:hypothetical protein [Cytophagales bacterium]MDW8384044.1 hypothetical protein [Flammeovirgaceae bacterium]
MKKLFVLFAAFSTVFFASCSSSTTETQTTEQVEAPAAQEGTKATEQAADSTKAAPAEGEKKQEPGS